ncbi:hypothetical protein CRG98_015103 [Punica granatum]|uniref:Uncharacterized protein n=1 Tax=Punica granatum TaxID=22663 RepID=A0A2I0K8M4_PUNGR|nr:hypothetical protein CRG98_015103 [Punica granatum]
MGRATETRTRSGCPLSFIALGVFDSLTPRDNARESHGKGRGALRLRIGQGALRPPSQGHGRGSLGMAEFSKGSPS